MSLCKTGGLHNLNKRGRGPLDKYYQIKGSSVLERILIECNLSVNV